MWQVYKMEAFYKDVMNLDKPQYLQHVMKGNKCGVEEEEKYEITLTKISKDSNMHKIK